jgi:uroporphyrin-III C-methyltransferase
VLYLGVANLDAMVHALRDGGLPAATPAAAIQNGTLPSQKSVVTTLSNLAAEVDKGGISSPAILVIGEVVRWAEVNRAAPSLLQVA